MPILPGSVWVEIIALALGVSLMESAVTGKLRRRNRPWSVPLRLRPVFGFAGFALLSLAIADFFRRLLKP